MVLTSRVYFLLPYAARRTLPPELEPFAITAPALVVSLAVAAAWCILMAYSTQARKGCTYMLVAALPGALWLFNLANGMIIRPLFSEVLWLSCWTGLSFGCLVADLALPTKLDPSISRASKWLTSMFWLSAVVCCLWWYGQQCWYFDNFLLGYNDYGHFLQRLSNTLSGQGMLIESPVLPRFWDHFNPGLLLLLPTWSAWPDVHQSFAWQALALAGSAYLICCIARAFGQPNQSPGFGNRLACATCRGTDEPGIHVWLASNYIRHSVALTHHLVVVEGKIQDRVAQLLARTVHGRRCVRYRFLDSAVVWLLSAVAVAAILSR